MSCCRKLLNDAFILVHFPHLVSKFKPAHLPFHKKSKLNHRPQWIQETRDFQWGLELGWVTRVTFVGRLLGALHWIFKYHLIK